VILGDVNSDLSIANNNTLIETMMMFNLVNIISKPIRITDHSNTLLDPIIISDAKNYIYSHVLKELHMSSTSSIWQRMVIQSTVSSFSINICLLTSSYSQTSRLNEPATLVKSHRGIMIANF
jgi:hypothetical protein